MKKSLKLAAAGFIAAVSLAVLVVGPARASVLGTWMYNLLQVNGPVTISNAPTGRGGGLGTLTVQGATTLQSTLSVAGNVLLPTPAAQTIAGGDSIKADACGGIKQITSAAPVTSSTTFPLVAPAVANTGCDMSIVNVGASTITIKAAALEFFPLNNADVVLGSSSTLTVISNGTYWYQTGGTQNR